MNDHLLKSIAPGLLTGKLSDIAGLCFFPLFLQGCAELGSATLWRPENRRAVLLGCVAATAIVFSGVKTIDSVAWIYRYGLGALQWPWRAVFAPVRLTMDATDLFALPALAIAVWCGWPRGSGRVAAPQDVRDHLQ